MSWFETTLGDCCDLYQPQTITTKELKGDGLYSVYGANGVIGKYDKYNHVEPQLLVTCRGATCGAVNISSPYSWINGNAMVVKPKTEELNIRFLEYFFRGAVDLSGAITGAAQPQITRQSLSPIRLTFPSLSTQLKIVEKLDAIFAEIDKATAAAEANIKNAQLLIREVIKKLVKEFSDDYFVKFGSVCDFVRGPFGGSLTKSIFVEKGYAVYEQQHPINNQFDSFRYFIDDEKFNEMKRFEVFPHDLLMSCSGVTLGKIGIVPQGAPRGIINQALLKITPKDVVSKDFLKIVMESDYFQSILWDVSGGAAQPNVPSVKVIKNFLIPIPNIKEQDKFVDIVSSLKLYSLDNIYKNKKTSLRNLKQAILKQAFSGELVKE